MTGLCIGKSIKNTIDATATILLNCAGVPVFYKLKMFSPHVTSFEIVQRGSGRIRNNLYRMFEKFPTYVPMNALHRGLKTKKFREGDASRYRITESSRIKIDEMSDPLLQ